MLPEAIGRKKVPPVGVGCKLRGRKTFTSWSVRDCVAGQAKWRTRSGKRASQAPPGPRGEEHWAEAGVGGRSARAGVVSVAWWGGNLNWKGLRSRVGQRTWTYGYHGPSDFFVSQREVQK